MPCNSRFESVIEWGPSTDPSAMQAGLAALGLNPRLDGKVIIFNGGTYHTALNTLTIEGRGRVEERSAEIKKSYMNQATRIQAKKFGFQIREGKNQYEYQLVKRTT